MDALKISRRTSPVVKTTAYEIRPREQGLPSSDVLGWEFDYIRYTASEAMKDRHTMINFYLLIAAVVVTGVVAVINPGERSADSLPLQAGTVLLWALSGIGWFYLLKIIRLREAWYGSARAMNRIKEFYILHSKEFPDGKLAEAFEWSMASMPAPDQRWNVFFYSAALIGFLNSLAFALGGVLLSGTSVKAMSGFLESNLWFMIGLAVAFFAFHILMYFAFLKPTN